MIVAFTPLHYGSPMLDAVIRSTEGFAEKHLVHYAHVPNFPGNPTMPNPDTREQLLDIAITAGGKRLHWTETHTPDLLMAMREHTDIEMMLQLDSDEIGHQGLLEDILRRYRNGELTHSMYYLPMRHFWRSFRWACKDSQWPRRLYIPNAPIDEPAYYPDDTWYIEHFGYAVPRAHMIYKWQLSRHKEELRPEWWTEIYDKFPERMTDLHPVSIGMWNAEPFEDGMHAACLMSHPNRYLDVIE
jgi:hypothetical protein